MKNLFRIMYIIVDRKGNGIPSSLSYQKKMCTNAFLKGYSITWNEAKTHVWKCIKVDVNITPSN
jgi:hypothetical protein